MKTSVLKYCSFSLVLFVLCAASTPAQVVEIPDPGLQDVIRTALNKPTGDLTAADMESLTTLNASWLNRGWDSPQIASLQGLEAAWNLTKLNLSGGHDGWIGARRYILLTTDLSPLAGLTNLTTLDLRVNELGSLTLPAGLTGLTTLHLAEAGLTNLTLSDGLPGLTTLDLSDNYLTSFTLPAGLTNLTTLDLGGNQLTDFSFLSGLPSLNTLDLNWNQLTNLTLTAEQSSLTTLGLKGNRMTDFSFLSGLPGLTALDISFNGLTNLSLPAGLAGLTTLDLSDNYLTDLSFPSGLASLSTLNLERNKLTNLTLPPELSNLTELKLGYNQLASLTLPQPVAIGASIQPSLEQLRAWVAVHIYPLATSLAARYPAAAGTFSFTLAGPPGRYQVQVTSDLLMWSNLNVLTNTVGSAEFTDSTAGQRSHSFYRVTQEP